MFDKVGLFTYDPPSVTWYPDPELKLKQLESQLAPCPLSTPGNVWARIGHISI